MTMTPVAACYDAAAAETLHCNSNYLCRPISYTLHAAFYDGVHACATAPRTRNCSSIVKKKKKSAKKNEA